MRSRRIQASAVLALASLLVVVLLWWGAREISDDDTDTGASASPTASASLSPTPAPPLAWGPTWAEWEAALADARALDVAAAAGQVLIASVTDPDPATAAALVERWELGGIIVMGSAVESRDQVAELTGAAREAGSARAWDVIVSVDQEGGSVARLRGLVPDLPGFLSAGAAQDKAAVREAFAHAATDMRELGFSVDFAPVADVTIGLGDPTIRSRSAGADPERVAATVEAAVDGLRAGGVVPVIKHFPGHGSVTADSHEDLPEQAASVEELEAHDLIPFRRAIEAGAPAVMMGHIAVGEWGPTPASLEPRAYQHLRDTWGFDGVIFTDAMDMGAVVNDDEPGAVVVDALRAGADAIVIPPSLAESHAAIVAAVDDGSLSRERLDEAVARTILLARWQAGLESAASDPAHAKALAAAGVTVAAEDCTAPFVGSSARVSGGFERDRDLLAEALDHRGVVVGDEGKQIHLVGADDGAADADVVVAMGGPWGLSSSSAEVYVGLYGRSADALEALAAVLTGEAAPGGRWPVDVSVPFPECG